MRRARKLAAAKTNRRVVPLFWHYRLLRFLPGANGKLLPAQRLDEFIVEIHAVIKILHADALIFAMSAGIVNILKHAGNAESGNAANTEVLAVTGSGVHHRHDWQTAVKLA